MSVSKQPGTAASPQYQHPFKLTTIDLIGGIKCPICHLTFSNKKDYDSHYVNHNTGNPNIIYMCVACNKEIVGYPTFRNHCYSRHVIKDRLTCEYCSKQFSKTSVLQQHIDNMHKFKCVHCKKEFPSKKETQMHQITHLSDSPPYKCQSCGQQIDSADTCEQHIDDHCTLTYSCPICNEVIPDKSESVDHLVKHFGKIEEPLPESIVELTSESSIDLLGGILCVYCDTTHKTRVELELHFAEYHIDKDVIYSCNICGKQYDKYPPFGNHCYYHYSKDKFECDDCDRSFPRLSLLVQHAEAFHSGPAASAFSCAHCHNTYASEKRLRTHLREVHGAECVECPDKGCGKMFDNPKDLIYHQAVHKTGHRCKHCLLQFTSLVACERHISVHCKKQYSCPVCTRSYAEKYLIMKHISQHFSSVLHLCKVCGKIFNAKHRLVEHSKVHSDTRNYKCTYCDKSFTKTNHLKQHLNIHTGLKPYQCNLCPKTFGSYPNYHKHVRRMHNGIKVNKPRKQITEVMIVNEKEKVKAKVSKKGSEPRNNNNVMEDLVDSTSSELDAYAFVEESDDSMVESDGINPLAMEHESKIFEAAVKGKYTNLHTTLNNVPEFTEILPENNHDAFVAAVTPSFGPALAPPAAPPPAEYGPDFGKDVTGFIDLDDQLPHIDPLLTIKNQPAPAYEPYPQPAPSPYVKWEPLISKVYAAPYGYDADAAILSVLNTDIY